MNIKKISFIIAIGMATLFTAPAISSFATNINTNNTEVGSINATGTIQFTGWNYTDIMSQGTWYSNIVGSINNGENVTIIGQNNNWYEINFNGNTGWIPIDRVNVNNANNGTINFPSIGYTDVMSRGTWFSNVAGTLNDGTAVGIIQNNNGWDEINYNGQIVWTPKNRINETGTTIGTGIIQFEGNGYTDVMNLGTWFSSIIGSLNNGTNVNIIGESNNWYEVSFNGGTGWIPKSRILMGATSSQEQSEKIYFNQLSYTDIMNGPTWDTSVAGTLNNGTSISVIGQDNGWDEIEYNGSTAWVINSRVDTNSQWKSQLVNNIINYGEQFIGTPYVWGGESPSGFDCSGLMQYIFENNGVNIPRTTEQQQQCGTPVAPGNLEAGDLVFWGYPAYHVAMYIGNGKILVAPHTGTNVQIMNLYPYTDARRIIN